MRSCRPSTPPFPLLHCRPRGHGCDIAGRYGDRFIRHGENHLPRVRLSDGDDTAGAWRSVPTERTTVVPTGRRRSMFGCTTCPPTSKIESRRAPSRSGWSPSKCSSEPSHREFGAGPPVFGSISPGNHSLDRDQTEASSCRSPAPKPANAGEPSSSAQPRPVARSPRRHVLLAEIDEPGNNQIDVVSSP